MSRLTCAATLGLFFALAATAQTTANIGGTVRDATGAVLRDVQMSARNMETGVSRNTRTGVDGRFLVPALPVGRYEVRAELERFRPRVQRDVALTVGETRVLDLQMELGSVDQEITVVGQTAAVNTSSSE